MTAIDLSKLPPAEAVEALDPETLFERHIAQFVALYPEYSAWVESDPAQKQAQAAAWREYVLRVRINEAVRSILLAYARGGDLDNLGALVGVEREDGEGDERFRVRIQEAPEVIAAAGPASAYRAIARNADASVIDVSVDSSVAGTVDVTVLGGPDPDGAAPAALVATVTAALNDDDARPLTDTVVVAGAEIVPYEIDATLTVRAGVESATVLDAATQAVTAYALAVHRLGATVARSLVTAALAVEGVNNVELTKPAADVECTAAQAPWPTTGTAAAYTSPDTHPLDGISVA